MMKQPFLEHLQSLQAESKLKESRCLDFREMCDAHNKLVGYLRKLTAKYGNKKWAQDNQLGKLKL